MSKHTEGEVGVIGNKLVRKCESYYLPEAEIAVFKYEEDAIRSHSLLNAAKDMTTEEAVRRLKGGLPPHVEEALNSGDGTYKP